MSSKQREDRHLDEFISNMTAATNAPAWIQRFRDSHYASTNLPFLVMYQAVAIAGNPESSLYKNKGAAIAIATKQLQGKGYMLSGTQRLSVNGDFREIAVLRELGERRSKSYVTDFDAL